MPFHVLDRGEPESIDVVRSQGFDVRLFYPGRPLQVVIPLHGQDAINEVDSFYGDTITPDTLDSEFFTDGAVETKQALSYGQDAKTVYEASVKGRSAVVDLGSYDGAVLWEDPLAEGGRALFGVYWSDGTYDWGVIAATESAEQAITAAQSLYCK